MRDDDLRNFFDEDAYNELLNVYAEEDAQKHREAAQSSKRAVSSDTRRMPSGKELHEAASRTEHSAARQSADYRRSAQPAARKAAPHQTGNEEPIMPLTPAAPPKNFKVEIKGLDEEFNTQPPRNTASPSERRAAGRSGAAKKPHETDSAGAFAGFSEIIKKRHTSADPAAGNFMVEEDFTADAESAAVKKRPEKPDWNTIQAFFVKNKKTWIIVLICVVASILLSAYTISCMNDVFAIHRDSENVVTINVPAEAKTKDVLKILKENDLIKHRHFCLVFSKIMKFKDDNYLTGVYYVTASMGVENMLSTCKVAATTGETVTLTFPEGYTVDQIVEKLEKYEVCSAAVLYKTMQEVDFSSEFPFIASMDDKEARYRMLEGYLYPDTYEFYVGESPSSVLRKFLNNFNKRWTDEYAEQAKKLGMSVDDVITLASIIQKEAFGADQSPLVSSVLHNRLNKSGIYPSLQCDSTTEYINEYIQKNVKSAVEVAKYTDRYSSYKCAGLPVGSICNPGDDAIKAALYPEKTEYYFFAHDANKKLYLARNDSERRSNNLAILNANAEAEKKKNNG